MNKGKLHFIKNNNFNSNIELKLFYGHTKAQIIPIIKYKNKTIVFCADLLPSTGHIPLPYVMGYDVNPLITLKEKELFLEDSIKNNYILFLEHDYTYECCTIKRREEI